MTETEIEVKFSLSAFQKLKLYIANVEDEVSGLGFTKTKGGVILVHDIILLPQEVTPAGTVIDKAGLAKYFDERMEKKLSTEDIRTWWHSHADMGVTWSLTDEQTIEDFDTEGETNNWILSVLGNHAGEFNLRLDVFSPFRFTYEDVKWGIDWAIDEKLKDSIMAEIKEKVTKPNRFSAWNSRKNKKKNKNKGYQYGQRGNHISKSLLPETERFIESIV